MPPKSKPKKRKTPKPIIIPTPENPTPLEFSTAIARTGVAQICHSIGFKVTQLSALETLTHVAINYLVAIAKSSASYAAKANRTDSNLLDFTNAIHDLSLVQGFNGASELHRSCVLGSTVLKDLAKFVEYTDETPFMWPIPQREKMGVEEELVLSNQESDSGRGVGLHVPRWLPGLPEVGKPKAVKRRNGEELWENVVVGNGNGDSENVGNGNGNGNRELGVKSKRGRVRFKIGVVEEKGGGCVGVKMRNGICRGGKRVSWNGNGSNLNTGIRILGVDDDGDGKG
ncbi:putative bromodomain associated domain-containing protein [Rosa chinensis]|uniref:Putative bromodomain associated domain-containing protein n=1 Tax=Rosa chinensis TaxID=74649 RepID=A0A2P6Q731_ROSCH|nr:transcription initiation factor TFIID subunit 8 [Rosa chinensis]PRQ29988.1 putative bromodomain associated domain-containing protein [Rosa chinensis]